MGIRCVNKKKKKKKKGNTIGFFIGSIGIGIGMTILAKTLSLLKSL